MHAKSISPIKGFYKHIIWQIRKIFNLFPFIIKYEKSLIEAHDKNQGVAALINFMKLYDYNNMSLIKILTQEASTFFDVGQILDLILC